MLKLVFFYLKGLKEMQFPWNHLQCAQNWKEKKWNDEVVSLIHIAPNLLELCIFPIRLPFQIGISCICMCVTSTENQRKKIDSHHCQCMFFSAFSIAKNAKKAKSNKCNNQTKRAKLSGKPNAETLKEFCWNGRQSNYWSKQR